MKTSDFSFSLPEELIAQHPLENRDESRLMLLNKKNGNIEHKKFKDIVNILKRGDVLVMNDSRVIPARLFGSRPGKNEKIEFLLIKQKENDEWEVLTKPGKKAKVGNDVEFGGGLLKAKILSVDDEGIRHVKFDYQGIFMEVLDKLGEMPLPPYIKEKIKDKERYQTVYSKYPGSAAAPTAGLHFTEKLLKELEEKGVELVYLTLHVGLGTFRPVKIENLQEHKMHSEFYSLSQRSADIIKKAKKEGRRVIAVGTTSIRTLESIASDGDIKEKSGWTDIFIYPGFEFKIVDGLITNFHLPESTLIMLVSAFSTREIILNAYKEAIKESYRFFSFGDAMFIME